MTGEQKTTSTTDSQPWKPAQPYLTGALGSASNLYSSGQGFNPYPGSTVSPMSSQTQGALSGMQGVAGQGDPLGSAANANAKGVLNSGGMSPWQSSALQGTHDLATGASNPYQGLLDQASNPYYQQTVDREAGKLTDDINRGFSNDGRYGSTAQSGAIADQVGGFRASMANANYNQGIANQRGILGDMTGTMMNAGQTINNAGNQAQQLAGQYTGMVPQLYDQQYQPSRMLGQVGSAYDAQNQAQLTDVVNRQQQGQQAPWNRLGAYSGMLTGIGGMGGTQTGTTTQPSNPLQTIGGIAGSILPFFSSGGGNILGAAGGAMPGMPWSAGGWSY